MMSKGSGRWASATTPQAIDPAPKNPPYAARMRPKFALCCQVATIPHRPRALTPVPL